MSARDMFISPDQKLSWADEKYLARTQLVYNVTEDILVALEKLEVSQKELARRLGKSQSHVSQLLDGSRNMTLGTLSDIALTIGADIKIKFDVKNCQSAGTDWQFLNANLNNVVDIKSRQTIWQGALKANNSDWQETTAKQVGYA